ncbi:MAG: SPOR domain-containing protein, partial [Novosphingobium sp.]
MQNARARQSPIRKIRYLVVALAATGFGFVTAGSAWGQSTGAPASVSRPVVQPLPAARGMTLNAALARLAQNPRDTQAMIDAGKAALMLGDVDAAIGFFSRARTVDPLNPYAKAGLAGALVRQENPFEAIPLFQEAERAGVVDADLAADRGLAYDLVGDNATAQRYYREALARGSSEEVTRRLALSYAIAGDRISADATLAPLLARGDKAAFRSRAFAMAIAGQAEEAVGIAYGSLPQELAAAISPYLRYMTRLTPAQQAAAANFGHFPRASEIGRDDPRVAQYAAANPRRGTLASADAALVPKGEPLGRKSRTRTNRQTQREQRQTGSMAARPTPMAAVASQRAAPPE